MDWRARLNFPLQQFSTRSYVEKFELDGENLQTDREKSIDPQIVVCLVQQVLLHDCGSTFKGAHKQSQSSIKTKYYGVITSPETFQSSIALLYILARSESDRAIVSCKSCCKMMIELK